MKSLCATILLLLALPCTLAAQTGLPADSQQAADTAGVQSQVAAQAQSAAEAGWGEMTPERRAQAIEYSDTKNIFYFVTTIYSFLVLILLLATGVSGAIGAWAKRVGRKRFFSLAIYLLAISLILLILDLPFSYYLGYVLEHNYGLSNQTLGAWLGDLMKGQGISYIVLLLLLWLLYLAIRKSPRRWWIWVGAFTAPVVAFFIVVSPILIDPMFNKFTPLRDTSLKEKILTLASEAGIHGSKVFEVDASKQSKKYNAYVTGLFGSKRIVLYDTILHDMTDDEILFIMAHEMGHYTMHHVWYGVAFATLFIFLAAFVTAKLSTRLIRRYQTRWRFSSLAEFASLPLIMLFISVLGFLGQPLSSGISRHFEHAADAYAIKLEPDKAAARAAFEKLAANNLSNPDPSAFIEFWLFTHPTIKDRVEYVMEQGES